MQERHLVEHRYASDRRLVDLAGPGLGRRLAELGVEGEVRTLGGEARRAVQQRLGVGGTVIGAEQVVRPVRGEDVPETGPNRSNSARSVGARRTGECTQRPPSRRRATVIREARVRPNAFIGRVAVQSPSSRRSSTIVHLAG